MKAAYEAMMPQLREQLAEQQISFRFIPPGAPSFWGSLGTGGLVSKTGPECSAEGSNHD